MKIANALCSSRMAFGCEALGGTDWGDIDITKIEEAIFYAYEKGVRIFDTANVYGLGLSEKRLGKIVAPFRQKVCIVTKGGYNWSQEDNSVRAKTFLDNSEASLTKGLHESLQRLSLETIPVYLIHRNDPKNPLETVINTVEKFLKDGKILQYGFSNHSIEEWQSIFRLIPGREVVSQFSMNLIEHADANQLLQLYKGKKVITMAYGCLAQGLLTGKYKSNTRFSENDRRHRLPHFQNLNQHKETFAKLEKLAKSLDLTMGQAAIHWVLSQPGIDIAVVGAKDKIQIQSNLVAINRLDA